MVIPVTSETDADYHNHLIVTAFSVFEFSSIGSASFRNPFLSLFFLDFKECPWQIYTESSISSDYYGICL